MSYLHNHRSSVGSFEEDAGSSIGDEETLTPHEAYEIERPPTKYQSNAEQQQQDNYVSSQSNGSSASTAKFWTQKRKLITVISSFALVTVVAAVGVVVSRESSPVNEQSLTQDIVITDDVGEALPSIAGDTAEPVAVETAEELISTQVFTEIIDDGIIYDFVAQQEVTVEEPDFNLDIVEFKGDLSDFIDSDVARLSIDADDESCNSEGALFELNYIADNFPWETNWVLYLEEKIHAWGPPQKTPYNRLTNYRGTLCLPEGEYMFKINDTAGDGLCCMYGEGGYKVTVGGAVIAESDTSKNDKFDTRRTNFTITPNPLIINPTTTTSTVASTSTTNIASTTTTGATEESVTAPSTQDPTESPSSEPSVIPTQGPSIKPTPVSTSTSAPTITTPTEEVSSDSDLTNCADPNDVIVGIQIFTDKNGAQTGYTLTGSNVIKERATGSMESETEYLDEVCVPPGTYELTIKDTVGNGIRGSGYVAVYVGGQKAFQDYRFNGSTKSYTIQVGFNPSMTDTDVEWLDGLNRRRKEFHEANGEEFHPVVWSPQLAEGASVWAAKIFAIGCKPPFPRETNLISGELTFTMTTGNEYADLAQPEKVMSRWYDKRIDETVPGLVADGDTPGLAFTQVVWKATRYIGCTKQTGQFVDPKDGIEKWCHVDICRFDTAGNCNVNMQANSWKEPTLADKSICGNLCTTDGCY